MLEPCGGAFGDVCLSLLVLLLVAEHFSVMKPVVAEQEMKMKMMRQLWGQQQRNPRHGLKLRFLSMTSLFASLLQGDFRVEELDAFER